MTTLAAWAARHAIPPAALDDLRRILLGADDTPPATPGASEAAVQSQLRIAASQVGGRLWRNNVGVLRDERGVPVRFGLCNESPVINARCKSSDLIGLRPHVVTPADMGRTLGVFMAREVKRPGWRYAGTPREVAQLRFIELVVSLGGDAAFTTGAL